MKLEVLRESGGWRFDRGDGRSGTVFGFPRVEIDGKSVEMRVDAFSSELDAHEVFQGVYEEVFSGQVSGCAGLELAVAVRFSAESPVTRFKFIFRSARKCRMTKSGGADNLRYLSWRSGYDVLEVRLGSFNEQIHSYMLTEHKWDEADFETGMKLIGPILCWKNSDGTAALAAYEHGSQAPDAFVAFSLDGGGCAALDAQKGNYIPGTELSPSRAYETIWFETACTDGDFDGLAAVYRDFVLNWMSPNRESRKAYVFYNTWNNQERVRWWKGGESYLSEMNAERMMYEAEVAHSMGVEVFVVDTGWFSLSGDWRVDTARFPDGMRGLRERLESFGMKLGLWFNPSAAAVQSRIYSGSEKCLETVNGRLPDARKIWETPESRDMCLVSGYWEKFADELIRLNRELGVSYFKWDAVGQYGCDSPDHFHGDDSVPAEERRLSHAFLLPEYLCRIADRVCAACPDAIVDFDVTEGGRCMGLAFLASGKYFLINNGPYFHNMDHVSHPDGQGLTGMGINVFVYPGPARTWICRTPLSYDKWIPSVLFLTHYLPDDPLSSQSTGLASLVLGQSGIWGDLGAVSESGVRFFSKALSLYRQVRDDISAASPYRSGLVACTPEIHEKINRENGRGVVSVFSASGGDFEYVTRSRVQAKWCAVPEACVRILPSGHALISGSLGRGCAAAVFFGAEVRERESAQ